MKTGTGQVGRRADDQAHAGSEFERSLDRLRNLLAEWRELGEVEAKFNPSQPRVPAGVPDGGRWSGAGGWISTIHLPSGRDILGAAEGAPLKVQEFLQTHRESVTRLLGAVQATGGALEGAAGVALVGSGVATSETGVGIGVAGLGAWMVTNGYDNFDTGLHVLATGAPRATRLNTTLRSFGLTESQADATEVLLAGGEAVGASKLGARALEAAARRAWNGRQLEPSSTRP